MHRLKRPRLWGCITLFAAFSIFGTQPASSQIPDLFSQTLQRAMQGEPVQTPDSANAAPVQVYQPVVPDQLQTAPPSRLEALYSARAGRPLKQFGYDTLGVPAAVSLVQVGTVQDNYVLGQGDEIVVVLRGQENATYRQRVDRDGQVILPKLDPILANGRSFGDFRADLERRIAQAYLSTNAFISLGAVRQVSVLITGEVRAPGLRILNALATPLDAILLSGGIAKTGSLRNVALIRGSEKIPLDLYAMITQGATPNVGGLQSGDRIYVPPLRDTVAIAGYVRRPGIYELRNGPGAMEAEDLVALAGGLEIGGKYRLSKMSLQPDGSTRLMALAEPNSGLVHSGEVLFVDTENDSTLGRVTLAGAVQVPGTYPLSLGSSVMRIVRDSTALACNAYTPLAVIVRRDPILNARTLVPFSLAHVFASGQDIPLQNDDAVYVFSRNEARILGDVATRQQSAPLRPGTLAQAGTLAPTAISGQTGSATVGDNAGLATSQAFGLEPPCEKSVPQDTIQTQSPAGGNAVPAAGQYQTALPVQGPYAAALAQYAPYQQSSAAEFLRAPGLAPLSGLQQAPASLLVPQPPAAENPAPPAAAPNRSRPPSADQIATDVGVPAEALVRLAADHVIWVLDEVRDPGAYISGEGTTLTEMIQTAGGLLRTADLSAVEVTSTKVDPRQGISQTIRTAYNAATQDFRAVALEPHDVIRLRAVYSDRLDGRVAVSGEVRYPGTFEIVRGEHLSSLLERAGGLTKDAYPYGAVFTRVRAASSEKDANNRTAQELDAQLGTLAVLSSTNSSANAAAAPGTIAFLSTLAQRVRNTPALGRIATTVDPEVLRTKPALDIILEPGDRLFIPPRPSTVTVSGEVLNPGSLQYRAGLTVRDYVTAAGGETQGADGGRTFIIYPDGTAKPVEENWISFGNGDAIPPGSTVVVPRDLQPFQLSPFLRDVTQIMGQLAITAASLAVIH